MQGEDIRRRYGYHYILRLKNQGVARALKGNVAVTLVFLDDDESVWDDEARTVFMKNYLKAMHTLSTTAATHGVELSIITTDINYRMSGRYGESKTWLKEFLKEQGAVSVCQYAMRLKNERGYAESPLVFALNRPLRSHAKCASLASLYKDEFSVVDVADEPRIIMHELLHQFGAEDYYEPKAARIAADAFLPDTIMVKGKTIDSLTRYLIGWSDHIDEDAVSFLDAIKDIPFRPKEKKGLETEC